MPVRRGGAKGLLERNPIHIREGPLSRNSFAFASIQPVTVEFRRPAVGRIVFEAAVMGRIVRGRDHDAVGEPCCAPPVVSENRVRNSRGRSVFIAVRDHDFHAVGRQHLQRAGQSRHGERMRVHAEKQRAVDVLLRPVQANGLADGQDMPFVEGLVEGGSAMPRGAEGNPLFRHRRVRCLGVIGRHQSGYIHQHRGFGRLSGKGADFHRSLTS